MSGSNKNGWSSVNSALAGKDPVILYCLTARVADGAARGGHAEFSRALETAMQVLLQGMTRVQQSDALCLSLATALNEAVDPSPRLRLVHSRKDHAVTARPQPSRRHNPE